MFMLLKHLLEEVEKKERKDEFIKWREVKEVWWDGGEEEGLLQKALLQEQTTRRAWQESSRGTKEEEQVMSSKKKSLGWKIKTFLLCNKRPNAIVSTIFQQT